ncbi:hypothetical protein BZZ01_13510 [Nostocales cyanobacterium HT-58-2]|nr:hypothetical protein BZZ01_13510 [Nostocales cyanobacterium HT-58-2]
MESRNDPIAVCVVAIVVGLGVWLYMSQRVQLLEQQHTETRANLLQCETNHEGYRTGVRDAR